jgi:NAD(P)-dependent dehydrogenase (short-subunit alcohol dehydrogenase family)
MDIAGKVTVVTGAGAGTGRVIALALAGLGARVVVADIDGAAAQAVSTIILGRGGTGRAVPADICGDRGVEAIACPAASPANCSDEASWLRRRTQGSGGERGAQDGRARGRRVRGRRVRDCGAGAGGKAGPAAGEQRAAVVEQHDAVAEQAPALLGMAGAGLGRGVVDGQRVRARGPMLTRLASHRAG